jgi:hypothetical protein
VPQLPFETVAVGECGGKEFGDLAHVGEKMLPGTSLGESGGEPQDRTAHRLKDWE